MPANDHLLGDLIKRQSEPVLHVLVEAITDTLLVIVGPKLGTGEINFHGLLQCRRTDLNGLPRPASHFKRQTQSSLPCHLRRNQGKVTDQDAFGLPANILLEIPRFRSLSDK